MIFTHSFFLKGGGGGSLYDQLINTRIFALEMNKPFIWVLEIMMQMAMGTIQFC